MGFAVRECRLKWTGGVIPYLITGGNIRDDARTAVMHWNLAVGEYICLIPRTTEHDHVVIRGISGDERSSSQLGRVRGRQEIAINIAKARRLLGLGRHSSVAGIIVHELGHAAGLMHEHQRQDRDHHVTIHWDNLLPRFCKDFYSRGSYQSPCQLSSLDSSKRDRYDNGIRNGSSYDFDSIMHYLHNQGADDRSKSVITKKGSPNGSGASEPFPGQLRGTLSVGDCAALRRLYPRRQQPSQTYPPDKPSVFGVERQIPASFDPFSGVLGPWRTAGVLGLR